MAMFPAADVPRSSAPPKPNAAYTSKDDATTDHLGTVLYGMDKELAEKAAAKYDPRMESEARQWIEAVVGRPLEGTLHEALKSGVVLCETMNAIVPGACKASKMSAPFKQRENISLYLAACDTLGVPKHSQFQTVDLYEEKNMMQVITNLHALGAAAQRVSSYSGPTIGVKIADMNRRDFSDETLKAGRAQQTFLGKGSHGHANAAGMIDHSKNINKIGHVDGVAGLGQNTETGLLGKGSHGHANAAGMIDHSKNINKMGHVTGVDAGMGQNTETGLLGKGSHGHATAAGMIDHSKDINKMGHVQESSRLAAGGA